MGKISTMLGDSGISISAILQHEISADRFVPVVITTHQAREGSIREALARIKALDVIEGQPVCIRIVDMPEG